MQQQPEPQPVAPPEATTTAAKSEAVAMVAAEQEGPSLIAPGWYYIKNWHGKNISVHPNSVTHSPNRLDYERIKVEPSPQGNGLVVLRSVHNNVLSNAFDRVQLQGTIQNQESFVIRPHPTRPKCFTIYSRVHSTYFCQNPDGSMPCGPDAGDWNAFEFIPLSGEVLNGMYFIKNAHHYIISVHPNIVKHSANRLDWERIMVETSPLGNGKVALRSFHNTVLSNAGSHVILQQLVQDAESFVIRPHATRYGLFSIFCPFHGTYINQLPDGSMICSPEVSGWNAFEFIPDNSRVWPGKYYIKNWHGQNISVHQSIVTHSPNKGEWECITVEPSPQGNGKVALRSFHNTVLSNAGDHVELREIVQDWESFELVTHYTHIGRFSIFCPFHGTYFSQRPDGNITCGTNVTDWEAFDFIRA